MACRLKMAKLNPLLVWVAPIGVGWPGVTWMGLDNLNRFIVKILPWKLLIDGKIITLWFILGKVFTVPGGVGHILKVNDGCGDVN